MKDDNSKHNPKYITACINNCRNFNELLNILYDDNNDFNHIHLSAMFHKWSFLWQKAHRKADIQLMSDHLNKESFSWLLDSVYREFENLGPVEITSISNAISHFPLSPQRSQLVIDMADKVNESSLKKYKPRNLATLANAMAHISPEDKTCIALMNKLAGHLNKLTSLQNFKPQALSNIANAMAIMGIVNQILFLKLAQSFQSSKLDDYTIENLSQIYQFYLLESHPYCRIKPITLYSCEVHPIALLRLSIVSVAIIVKRTKLLRVMVELLPV